MICDYLDFHQIYMTFWPFTLSFSVQRNFSGPPLLNQNPINRIILQFKLNAKEKKRQDQMTDDNRRKRRQNKSQVRILVNFK